MTERESQYPFCRSTLEYLEFTDILPHCYHIYKQSPGREICRDKNWCTEPM